MTGAEAWLTIGAICLAADAFIISVALVMLAVKWMHDKLTQKLEG